MVWTIIGWTVWVFVFLTAVHFTQISRNFIKKGGEPAKTEFGISVLEATFSYIALALFLVYPWSKLHLIWIWPIIAFGVPFLILPGFPLVTPIIIALTRRIFIPIILVGVKQNNKPYSDRKGVSKNESKENEDVGKVLLAAI